MVLPRCRSSRAAEGCDSTDLAEQDAKRAYSQTRSSGGALDGRDKGGDSGVDDVWRYDRVKGMEIERRAKLNLIADKC